MAKILVVDDFDDSRFSLCRLLEMSGHETLEAKDGHEAVEIALRDRPDVVLMDVSLPDFDGIMATERIRRDEAPTRMSIIMLTAHDSDQFQDRALGAGADDFVTKPVDFDHLTTVIARHV